MNANVPAKQMTAGEIAETVLIKGDLSKLSPEERNVYYFRVCESVGLNPLTQPLAYIQLSGKLTLYAKKDCTDQLRALHKISVTDMTESEREGVYIVTSKVANADGRTDMAKGAVNIAGLKGEALANAIMKTETKSKRRATLSICGLGILDETEIEDIPAAQKREVSSEVPSPPPAIAPPSGPHTLTRGNSMKVWSDAYLGFIRSSATIAELQAWDNANAETLDIINEKDSALYKIINGTVEARMREINPKPKRTKVGGVPSSEGDPDLFIVWAKQRLQTADSAELLDQIFNDEVSSSWDGLFPPDREELLGEHKRLRAKFEE